METSNIHELSIKEKKLLKAKRKQKHSIQIQQSSDLKKIETNFPENPINGSLISVGCYDGTLIGYLFKESILENVSLYYAFKPTEGSLRSLHSNENFLCISGNDEKVRIYNIASKQEAGMIIAEKNTVNILSKEEKEKYLLSTSGPGILITRLKDLMVLHTLKFSKLRNKNNDVLDIAIHPSGKLLLAIYSNQYIILWDLMNARKAFVKKTKFPLKQILFSENGEFYVIVSEKKILIYNISEELPYKKIKTEKPPLKCILVGGNLFYLSNEGKIFFQNDVLTFNSSSDICSVGFNISEKVNNLSNIKLKNAKGKLEDYLVCSSIKGSINLLKLKFLKRNYSKLSKHKIIPVSKKIEIDKQIMCMTTN